MSVLAPKARPEERVADEVLSDEAIVERVRQGETALFELLMRRTNQRLFRIVRSILKDESEVEDVMQEAYIAAYSCLHQFAGRAKPATWIIRIAIHNAYARLGKRRRLPGRDPSEFSQLRDPEQLASVKQNVLLLEQAIDALPDAYRVVFVMREVEGLDTYETSSLLDLSEEAVRVRLHRAKAMLRQTLTPSTIEELFSFLGRRCDRIVSAVLSQLLPAEETTHPMS